PFQYFWDTCFHVYTLTALGEHDMAKKHLRSLFGKQEKSGFVGHIIYWKHTWPGRIFDLFQLHPKSWLKLHKPHMSALVQPPLVAQALQRIYQKTNDKAFLQEMLPKLKNYYKWLLQHRDFEGNGLLSIISPYESGMDWKASYDPVLKFKGKGNVRLFWKVLKVDMFNFFKGYNLEKIYEADKFIVKDAAFNTIFAQNLEAMALLCKEVNDADEAFFRQNSEKCAKSILELMYDADDEAFYDLAGKENRKLKVKTPTIFFPVVLKNIPDEICKKVLHRHLLNPKEFQTKFPIPSLAIDEPAFNPTESIYIWRGPTWIMFNWFLHRFMLEKNYPEEAERLLNSFRKLIEKSGFREYYNPFTGQGYGAKDFTWSGLVLDMWEMQEEWQQ
ncbi:MAG: trehalase-like protein, partial [Hymenobacteraceae bacterium]|nr:trehalase-like protein [Hymenobacteraceae bacterium]MDX5397653.1 trehalase-like protein [Hymenobacteraceae bacterium]MDX5513730.1 trehalase-like protein [Hymenobacteraceae bacterium]